MALVLARFCELRRPPETDFLPDDQPYAPTDVAAVNQHGIVTGG